MRESRIKRLRAEMGMTQEDLAEMLGVSRSMVAMWEGGVREPRTYELSQMSGIFHVPVGYLVASDEYSDPDSGKIDLSRLNADGLAMLYRIYDTLRYDKRYNAD